MIPVLYVQYMFFAVPIFNWCADMTSYLKFFHISLQESYISNKANASVKGWEK